MTTPNTSTSFDQQEPRTRPGRTEASDTAGPRHRVLIVEDDPDARLVYTEWLTQLGYVATSEASGERGVEAALRAPPDAILMDIEMRGIGGLEATRRIKADARTRDCLVIVVTGHGESQFAEARVAGCDAYFCKPFNPVALDEVLRVLTTVRGPVRPSPAEVVKECGCGRRYTRDEWVALPFCGRMHVPGSAFALELRNCACGSSIAVQSVESPGEEALR